MSTVLWNNALEGVTPAKGGAALPPATYRLKAVAGEGKKNSSGGIMMELQFEVVSGPLQGRKQFHNENLPNGNTDNDKTRMAFFLGLMDAYGITGAQLQQMFGNQAISVETVDYIAKQMVSMGRVIKGSVVPQAKDPSRVNVKNFIADDGIEPEPPKQAASAPAAGGPFGQAPQGGGFPGQAPGQAPGGFPQGGAAPGLPPQEGGNVPLGGFPGSGGMQPNAVPEWANQAPAAAQAPQGGQFQQQAAPVQDQGFPGQQFPGQVNPAAFPAQGQPQQAAAPQGDPWANPGEQGFQQQAPAQAAPGQQMPGIPQAQQPGQFGGQPQGAPGLPTGGFPQGQQPGGAPQANF